MGCGPWGHELGCGPQAAGPWVLRWAMGRLLAKPQETVDFGNILGKSLSVVEIRLKVEIPEMRSVFGRLLDNPGGLAHM